MRCDTLGHSPKEYFRKLPKTLFSSQKRKIDRVKIWIDADAAPLEVKQIVFRAAQRLNVQTVLVANRWIETPAAAKMISSVQVRDGANEADRFIATHGLNGDIAITADLPLAGELVAKGLFVVDPRGDEYSPNNIAARLSVRDFMDSLRGTGMVTGGSAPYGDGDKKAFAATFDRLLTKALRRANSVDNKSGSD